MAISVNPLTHVISIPKADLSWVSGTLYNHDTEAFRLELRAWEDDVEGIVQPKTHNHNTEYTIGGITYARAIEILPPYSIEFEDGQYSIVLIGSNNNIWDVAGGILTQNQVQVIPTNSAGLIVKSVGSGMSTEESNQLAELYEITGLKAGTPAEASKTFRRAGSIDISISSDGDKATYERQ